MTVDITDVVTSLKAILDVLVDVDESSLSEYTPAITSQKIALLIVPYQQSGLLQYSRVGAGSYVHAHRIPCEFWVKVDTGNIGAAIQRGRDICLQAMRLIAASQTLNLPQVKVGSTYLGDGALVGQYDILPRYEDKGGIPYVVARLFVQIEIQELAAF